MQNSRKSVHSVGLALILILLGACSENTPVGPQPADEETGTSPTTVDTTDTAPDPTDDTAAPDPGDEDPAASRPQLVINEIMFNPKVVSDDLGEWLELVNVGNESVDLQGWTLRDEYNNQHVIATSVIVEAGAYVVLGRNGDTSQNGDYPAGYVYADDFMLANRGDTIILSDGTGALIDQVTYGVDTPWPASVPGVSIELNHPADTNTDGGAWSLATLAYGLGDLGTPGAPNGRPVGDYTIDDTVANWQQPALNASLFFSPNDDLEDRVVEQLEAAQTSIQLAFFNIRLPRVRAVLEAKNREGVAVHVILDKKQQDQEYNRMGEDLETLGVPMTLVENIDAENATMHNKFAVIDEEIVMTGSANYSFTALNVSDEDLLIIGSRQLAARFSREFAEIVAGTNDASAPYEEEAPVQVWMGPEDGLSDHVVEALERARTHVAVAMFQINTSDVINALVAAHQRGVNVVVIVDEVQASKPGEDGDEQLIQAGIQVVLAHNTGSNYAEMHSKFAVIDHQLLLMGSYNWTNLGSYFNDENMLAIYDHHLATRAEGKLAELVIQYGGNAASLGLTVGPQTVTFSMRNVTVGPGLTQVIDFTGAGGPDDPIVLDGNSTSFEIEAGTRLSYFYEIWGDNGRLLRERRAHSFTVPYAPGPFVINDTFQP